MGASSHATGSGVLAANYNNKPGGVKQNAHLACYIIEYRTVTIDQSAFQCYNAC